jgi:Calpain family cysteine protease/Bacterial pre-peptidase C-terminal domain
MTFGETANNNFQNSTKLNFNSSVVTFTDSVSALEGKDVYSFTVSARSSLNLTLDGLTDNVNVELLNGRGDVLSRSARSENKAENISRLLDQGDYFICVYPGNPTGSSLFADSRQTQFGQNIGTETSNSDISQNPYKYTMRVFATPVDNAGNNLANAREVGVGTGNTTLSDWVGRVDTNDFYRFRLNADSNFSLRLSGLAANADVELLDGNGQRVQLANNLGTGEETISRQLGAGLYYARVFANTGVETNYNINFTATPDAGNTLATAREFSVGSGTTTFKDWVGTTDPSDIYRFNLAQNSFVNLRVNGLAQNVDLELLDNTGRRVAFSGNTDKRDETITRQLNGGPYFVRVFSNGATNTNYNFSITSTPDAGNTFGNARQINVGPVNTSYTDWVGSIIDAGNPNNNTIDSDDFYRFTLNETAELNLTLSNLSGNANVQLLDSSGNLIQASSNPGTTGERISRLLNAGTYFTRVFPDTGASSNYTLNILAAPLDNAGNDVINARVLNLGAAVNSISPANAGLRDWVGAVDRNDFYRFTLDQTSHFNATVSGLTADVNIRLLDAQGNLIQLSSNTASAAESITRRLNPGNYFLDVFGNGSNVNSFYNINLSTTKFIQGEWASQNLSDPGVINLARSLAADGQLTRNDTIEILRSVRDGGVVDAAEFQDLRTIVGNANRFKMQDHVRILADKVVNGDLANQNFQNQKLGNLVAGSSDTQMDNLINKWFLGSDRPKVKGGSSYQYAQGSLFQNGIRFDDIKQGEIGTCYLLATLSAIALEAPKAIENMFIDNGDGTFTVRFFNDGVADYLTVDRFLPTDSKGNLVYASRGSSVTNTNNELWVALAEKAYAQLNESGWIYQDGTNTFAGIEGGWMGDPKEHITGVLTDWNSVSSMEQSELVDIVKSNKFLSTGFYNNGYGVVSNHAYTITSYNPSTDRFSLYNPWAFKHADLNWKEMTDLDAVFVWST